MSVCVRASETETERETNWERKKCQDNKIPKLSVHIGTEKIN